MPTIVWAEVNSNDTSVVQVLADAVISPLTLPALQACLEVEGSTITAVEFLNALMELTLAAPLTHGQAVTLTLTVPSVDPLRTIDGIDFPAQALALTNNIGNTAAEAVGIVESQSGFYTASAGVYGTTVAGAMALTDKRIPGGCSGYVQCDTTNAIHRGSILGLSSAYCNDTAGLIDFRCVISDNSPYPIVQAASSTSTSSGISALTVGTDTAIRIGRDMTTRKIYIEKLTSGVWGSRFTFTNFYDGDLYPVVGLNLTGTKRLANPQVVGAVAA